MANCAQARPGHIALEPFCGTGGIMVALSHFGAHVTGGEIDIRVVMGWKIAYTRNEAAAFEAARSRGAGAKQGGQANGNIQQVPSLKGGEGGSGMSLKHLINIGLVAASDDGRPVKDESTKETNQNSLDELYQAREVFTNFIHYGLPCPEVVLCDNSKAPWRSMSGGWCDSIVTDPPYGVRAGAKKQGRDTSRKQVEIRSVDSYIPSKVAYEEDEMSRDLMTLAADVLKDNGRLVFLLPVDLADFLGIDRAAVEQKGSTKGNLHDAAMPKCGRKKDPRLCISETTRDPLLLDETRYTDFIPSHADLELVGASLQVLSGGLGRLLVTMRRRPRAQT